MICGEHAINKALTGAIDVGMHLLPVTDTVSTDQFVNSSQKKWTHVV